MSEWYDSLDRQQVRIPTGPFAQQRAEATARALYGPHVELNQVGWDAHDDTLIYLVEEDQ
jgi:hypothetical protein